MNPVREVEKLRERYDATPFAFYSPEEVHALERAAASEQDGAIFLTAAFTGLRRGELIALRWRDVDFERSAIRFHDLRHTFGMLAVRGAESIVELENWLGHAEVRTTMRYTHYQEQQDVADRLAKAFEVAAPPPTAVG
jgi:integrase